MELYIHEIPCKTKDAGFCVQQILRCFEHMALGDGLESARDKNDNTSPEIAAARYDDNTCPQQKERAEVLRMKDYGLEFWKRENDKTHSPVNRASRPVS